MSLLSEKFLRFPNVNYDDLICTDSLDYSSQDIDMTPYTWKTEDQEFTNQIQKQQNQVNSFYLETRQPFITASMRSLLLDWVIEISSEFFLKRETCHKAIQFIDRFLSVSPPVKKEHFQLLGLTSCIIACKLEEICYPKITDFIKSAGNIYSVKDIRVMERAILAHLSWQVTQPTSLTIIEWLTSQWDIYLKFTFGSVNQLITLKDTKGYKRYREIMQLLDACILDIQVLKYQSKVIAACACYLVLFKHFQAQNFELLVGNEEFEDKFDKGVQYFMQLFLNFMIGTIDITAYDDLSECGELMNRYMMIETSYELPNVCRNGLKPEVHFIEFLAYQTYNPLCIQVAQTKARCNN